MKTETVAGTPVVHEAEASAMDTTAHVRDLIKTIEWQRKEIAKLRGGVVHYADVGGLSIYESLEGREARRKDEVDRLRALCDQGAKKIDELSIERDAAQADAQAQLNMRMDAAHKEDKWFRLYKECAVKANETAGLKADLKKSQEAHEKTANKLADVIKERDDARAALEPKASELSWTQATLANAKGQAETSRKYAVSLERQLDEERAKTAELERTLSIVRGDLATAELARDKAREELGSVTGWQKATILPVVTLPADWLDKFNSDAKAVDMLEAELGAALHRAARAERKAAKANTELDELRKHTKALAVVVRERETVSYDCGCETCNNASAAINYLDSKKANG